MKTVFSLVFAILAIAMLGVVHISFGAALTATPNPFSLSNTTIDVGQSATLSSSISGGTGGPYYGQWTWINSNEPTGQVTNTITVGSYPNGVAFNPSGTLAYVTNTHSGNVSVIDTATNTVANTITVGSYPWSVAFNPSGTLAYVTNYGSGTVSVIDTATNTVANTITVGSEPDSVAFNPSGTLAYVTNYGSGTVSVIDTATNTVANTITLGYSYPNSVAFNPSGTLAYVAFITASSTAETTIDVIHTSTNTVSTINLGITAFEIALNPSGTLAYVTDDEGYQVGVIDLATNTPKFININDNTEVYPQGIVLNPSGTLAYVADYNSGKVSVIDTATNTLLENISVGGEPYYIALNPSGTLAYVTEYSSNIVSVINAIPETPVQALPSNDLFGLTATALNSNTMVFTSNGIQYDQGAGTSNIYGTWSLQGFAEDSNGYYEDSSTPIDIGNTVLLSNTLTVNPAPTATSLTPSASVFDSGQSEYETYNVLISGGTAPFTANLIYVSGPGTVNGITAGNVVETLTGQSDGTITFPSFNGFSTTGSYTFNVIAIDSASTPVAFNSLSNTITVNPALSTAPAPTAVAKVDAGQTAASDTLPATIGGSGTVTYTWYYSLNGGTTYTAASSSQCATPSGAASSNLAISCVTPSGITPGSYTFEVEMTDSASTPVTTTSTASGTATISSALAISLSPSSNTLDANQQLPLTATVSGGTHSFTLSYTTSNSICGSLSTTSNSLSVDGTNTIVFTANSALTNSCTTTITSSVTDSASNPVTETASSSLTVNPALTKPNPPTVSTPYVDQGQTGTVNAIIPTTGTSPYNYGWMVATPSSGGSFTIATASECATPNGAGASAGATETCTFSTSSSTATGAYEYELDVADSATTSETQTSSASSALTVNPAPTATSPTPSNTILDSGQYETYNVLITGGSGPFTANLIYVSGPGTVNGITAGNVVETNTIGSDGTIAFPGFNSFSTNGIYTFNVVATDSANTPVTFNSLSNTITVNPAPTATSLTPSNTAINSGQYVTYNVIINGGILPITANLVLVSNSIPIQINGANAISGTTYNTIVLDAGSTEPNTITFNSLQLNTSITSGGNVIFTVNAVDSANTPIAFNSVSNTVIINAVVVPHHSGSTGPPKYTFTLSDNINSTLNSAQPVYTIYASSGNTSYYQNQLPVTLSLLTPYLNVSWACNVSIGANTYTYQNDVYGLGLGIPCGKYYTTYTPNLEAIYSLSAPTKINVTTTSTTTILPTPPTPPANKSNKSITLNGSISSSSSFKINFTNMHVVVVLTSPSLVPMQASARITNETSMVLPTLANYTLISAFNISVTTAANVSSEVTSPYSCGLNSSLIKPFELVNGTWTAITPFSLNATACTVSFVVPKDPIVGIFQKIVPTTTVTTTVNTTTTIVPTTTVPPPKVNTAAIAVAVIVTVIILLVLAYYYMSKAGKHRRR